MTDIKFLYVVLKTLLFIVFLISGYLLSKSKSNSNYWKIAFLPIITFAVISGLRFGREIDYNAYYFNYTNKLATNEMDFFFRLIINIFNYLEIPYYQFVLFCSTFLITSFLYFLNKFQRFTFFILPLFLGLMGIENLIRWYFAFSFILLALRLLMDSRYFLSLLLAIIAFLVHSGIIICILVLIIFYFLINKKILNPNIAFILFTISLFFGSTDQLISASSLVNQLHIFDSSRYSNYTENAVSIASGEMNSGVYERSIVNNIRIYISFIFPIYFGGRYFLKNKIKYKKIIWLYNLAVFSIIIMPIFILVEIFNRFSAVLMVFAIIFVGISTLIAYKRRLKNKLVFALFLLSFLCSVYPILKIPFDLTKDKEMLFVWDANGRNYLPF